MHEQNEIRFNFFRQYSDALLKALDKAYFNEKPSSYSPQKKYTIETKGDENKEFLSTYQNKKLGHKFGVFVPADLQLGGALIQHGTTLSQITAFLEKKQNELRKDGVEFLLVPCVDSINKHWTILKISLNKDNTLSADYYDPSVRKKPDIVAHVNRVLKAAFPQINFNHKIILQQVEDINCGVFCHRMIQQLANKKTPDLLPKAGIAERIKDFSRLNKVKGQPGYNELDIYRFPKIPNALVTAVKNRGTLLAAGLIIGLSLSLALLIVFPPAGLAGFVATTSTAVGLGVPVLATIAGLALPVLGAIAGLIRFGINKVKQLGAPKVNIKKEFEEIPLEALAVEKDFANKNPIARVAQPSKENIPEDFIDIAADKKTKSVEKPAEKPAQHQKQESLDDEGFENIDDDSYRP